MNTQGVLSSTLLKDPSHIPVSRPPAFLITADSRRYQSVFAAQKLYNNIHA